MVALVGYACYRLRLMNEVREVNDDALARRGPPSPSRRGPGWGCGPRGANITNVVPIPLLTSALKGQKFSLSGAGICQFGLLCVLSLFSLRLCVGFRV